MWMYLILPNCTLKNGLRDTFCYVYRIIGVPEEEDKKKGHETLLKEIIAENFPKMGKEIVT